ncbi:carboxypeptidase-like regulatory domain-containing protein [Archangium gephyra]|uniref:carboxypeptidase regulatory-like domain-containing protein n=1 Tax=Archangium gephyra TaxID=48 RepID=UPI0035D3EDCA
MRRQWVFAAALVVLGLGLWLAVQAPSAAPSREPSVGSRASGSGSSTALRALLQAAPSAPGDARPHIRGLVRGPKGPVPGAVVLASALVAGESLSTLSCAEGATGQALLDCDWKLKDEQLVTLVEQRQGEAPVLSRAVTQEDGTFSLEGLSAGLYSLWVESAEGMGLRHGVAAGEEGVELRLGAGVRLSGRVMDEEEAPVPGALVTAIFMAHSRYFETFTDERGGYHLGPIPPGGYVLVISKDGLLSSVDRFQGHEGEGALTSTLYRPRRISGRVLLAGEPVVGAEVLVQRSLRRSNSRTLTDAAGRFSFEGLQPDVQELIATHGGYGGFLDVFKDEAGEFKRAPDSADVTLELAPVTHLQGVVLDETRRPIEGAWVRATQELEEEFIVASGRTDAQGWYRLGPGPVRPGLVQFDVRAKGHVSLREQTQSVAQGQGSVDFTLKRAAIVEGVVVDAAGQPVEGAYVVLRTPEDETVASANDGRLTEPDGRFSVDAPTPGAYRLRVAGSKMVKRVLEISAPSSQRIVVERLPAIEVSVVDEAGVPRPGVVVSLWSEAVEITQDRGARGITNLQGRYSLAAPGEGRYRVAAELIQDDFARSTSQEIDVGKAGAQVRLSFEAGRRLSGVVVDRRGQPLVNAGVRVLPVLHATPLGCGSPVERVNTGSDGRFTFQSVSGEQLELHVWKYGYLKASGVEGRTGLPLEPDAREVRVVLVKSADIKGRVVRADGSPVTVFRLNGEEMEDDEGRFFLPIHRTETMQLELSEPGSQDAPVRRTVYVQEEVDVDLGTITLGR